MAVEALLVLPVLLILTVATVEFSQMLLVEQQLAVAGREGARVAAQGGSAVEVEAAARTVLGTGTLASSAVVLAQLTEVSGNPVAVEVRVADASAVVSNLLSFVGYSIKGKSLDATAVMRRE